MSKITKKSYPRRKFLAQTGGLAAGIAILSKMPDSLFAAEEKKLTFYNWDTYIGENTLSGFKKKYGIDVRMDLFANNAELFSKIKSGNPGYDLICPSGDFVTKMVDANLLIPIDYSKVPNQKNLFKKFQDAAFDPGRKHSVSYMWGTIGIGYNSKRVKSPPDSWKYIYDSAQYSKRISASDAPLELIPIGLKYLGYSLNDTNEKHIQEVVDLLIKQKKHIKAFHSDNGQDLLLSGEVDLVQEYNGDIAQVNEEDSAMSYLVPKEGSVIWQDNLAIPKGAPHPDNAHKFINFILDADVGVDLADTIQYATPNEAAYKKMSKEYQDSPFIFPSTEVLDRCEEYVYKGVKFDQMIDKLFTRIKAA